MKKIRISTLLYCLLLSRIVCAQEDAPLPPAKQRQVIGNWLLPSFGGVPCAFSFESSGSKVYAITRCANGEGGLTGRLVKRVGPSKFVVQGDAQGSYRQILADGDLSFRDAKGEIHRIARYDDLWPPLSARGKLITPPEARSIPMPNEAGGAEGEKTKGLSCGVVGFRYGFVAGLAMLGKKPKPEWDFVAPVRCRQTPEFGDSLKRGLIEAAKG